MEILQEISCYHCGQSCADTTIASNDKVFCCQGCKLVYEMLDENGLCEYYRFETHPGTQPKSSTTEFDYLDEPAVRATLVTFDSPHFARAKFYVPAIHCSSCIWLLENFRRIDNGVSRSEVNFNRKDVSIDFDPRITSLSKIAGRMQAIGYPPIIQSSQPGPVDTNKGLVIRLGIAGFAFANVMLFSFPEYLGLDASDHFLGRLFSYLNLGLSVPVLLFSGADYFISAARAFRQKQINIEVPIALGLAALFCRSAYDIISSTGPGYLDSFTGLVFFLLIGRWFQGRTFESLSFDRDFRSYFPLAVQRFEAGEWRSTLIQKLKKGDRIRIRNAEVVPADALLESDEAFIDYSFVTGEARPVKAKAHDLVYAGGRVIGQPVIMRTCNEASNSHLTSLWNHDAFRKGHESRYKMVIDRTARKFTWIVLGIALVTAVYWYFQDPASLWLIMTSVLMVACPCALALAAPFTYGTMLNEFGRRGLYLKNADVVERLASIDSVVFDKTGTVTHGDRPQVVFEGQLDNIEKGMIRQLASASAHPLSSLVAASIIEPVTGQLESFVEFPGKGIKGMVDGRSILLGSASFTEADMLAEDTMTRVFVSIDGVARGYFAIQTSLRTGIADMLRRLGGKCAGLLSGDRDHERGRMERVFPAGVELRFNQSPMDKMAFVSDLRAAGKKVLMVGDGLNDAGALKQAEVGIAVTDHAGMFTPGSDAILRGAELHQIDRFLVLARKSSRILWAAFAMSFFYNAISLSFAVTGHLSPLVAAILMPISSISVVAFSSLSVVLAARRTLHTNDKENNT